VSVDIKSPKEIELMRKVCRLAAETLLLVGEKLRVGMTTDEIDRIVHADTLRQGARPAPLNYKGFPKSVCTSVNDIVCHGIPDGTVLKNGDIVNVDVTHVYEGFHGDTSATFYVGTPSAQARHVVEVARRALDEGIAQVRDGARLGDIGGAIQEYVEGEGCGVVRDFVGHGIGRKFHDAPQVKHYG
jgi:methionyl aminopeptidase